MTPGCTTQAVDFTAARSDFDHAGIEIVGISPDSPDKLAKFRDRKELTIRLLADEKRDVIEAYKAWGTRKIYGKAVDGVIRSAFLVNVDDDGNGTIEMAQYNVRATGHVQRLRRDLGLIHL